MRSKLKKEKTADEPIRPTNIVRTNPEPKSITNEKQPKVDLVRDANTIKDYYSAWDKYDVDRELTKLE